MRIDANPYYVAVRDDVVHVRVGALGASLAGAALTYGSAVAVFLLLATFASCALALAISLVVRDR